MDKPKYADPVDLICDNETYRKASEEAKSNATFIVENAVKLDKIEFTINDKYKKYFASVYNAVERNIYDILLTTFLILAAIKLVIIKKEIDIIEIESPKIQDFFIIGGLIGYVCGILGIGGGVLLTPIMVIKKWADTKTAAATSAIFIWFNSLSGLIGAGLSDQLVEFDNIMKNGA